MEFDIFLGVAALVIAAVLTWCILRFSRAAEGEAPGRRCMTASTGDHHGQGWVLPRYRHDASRHPITLRFDRKETGECTSHVVFPDLGTDTMLPGNETTEMSLPPLRPATTPLHAA